MNPLAARLRLALLSGPRRSGVRGTATAALRRSEGFEFAELREYEAGDDPRRIDWAASARAGALQTRVMIEDRAVTLAVALDVSGSMFAGGTPSNHERAREAATLWYDMATDEDRCAAAQAGGPLFPRTLPGRPAAHVCAASSEPRGGDLASALGAALAVLPRDTHLLILSDFFELDRLERVLRACAARFDSTALLIGDPWQGAIPLGGFVRLRDPESGRSERLFIGKGERARYRNAVERRERGVIERLGSYGIRAGLLDARPASDVLFELLRAPARRVA